MRRLARDWLSDRWAEVKFVINILFSLVVALALGFGALGALGLIIKLFGGLH